MVATIMSLIHTAADEMEAGRFVAGTEPAHDRHPASALRTEYW
jgi:hypothetical protein